MTDFNIIRKILAFTVFSLVLAVGTAAFAQDCYRHAECNGQDLCIENTCTVSEEPLDTCSGNGDCSGSHNLCDDGFCKMDGVYCQNPAGHAYEENMWGSCSCEDGLGSEWMGEEEPDPLLSDPELYDLCMEGLISQCGEEAPDINDECTGEQLDACTGYYDHVNALLVECGEEAEEVSFWVLSHCCEDIDDGDEEFQQVYDCVMGLSLSECALLEDCFDMGESAGDDNFGAGDDEQSTDPTVETSDCSFSPIPTSGGFLLKFFAISF